MIDLMYDFVLNTLIGSSSTIPNKELLALIFTWAFMTLIFLGFLWLFIWFFKVAFGWKKWRN